MVTIINIWGFSNELDDKRADELCDEDGVEDELVDGVEEGQDDEDGL